MKAFAMLAALAFLLAIAGEASAQVEMEWSRTYGGISQETCTCAIQTTDGGFALAGGTDSNEHGLDAWLVRTDANGDSLWSRTFGGENADWCNSIIQTTDGGFALAGFTTSFGSGNYNFWLIRTDANGDSLWSRTYDGGGEDVCYSMIQTADSGFALAGQTDLGNDGVGFWLVRANANGDSLWTRTYSCEGGDFCYSILQTADGGFALAGYSRSFALENYDLWLVRTDINGDSLWSHRYGGEGDDYCYSMIQTADSGFALAGNTYSFGAESSEMWLFRTDINGDSLWSRTYGGGSGDYSYSMLQTTDGGFALAGLTYSFGAECGDMWLVRTNSNGYNLWSSAFGGESYHDYCSSLLQTTDKGYALAGYTAYVDAGDKDFYLVKTTPDPNSISGNDPQPRQFALAAPYPNPFNSQTTIRYSLQFPSAVRIAVFDMQGQEVKTLVNDGMAAGEHEAVWQAERAGSGLYFIRLNAGGRTETRKAIVIR